MNGGVKAALLVSCMALGGCVGAAPAVEVRAIADPSAALSRAGDAVAVARGQFMLGNVGLALEGFRKAQRANPYDPAALQGIGDCYSAMGRFDLAQSNYEAALALTPHDSRLLLGLALIYERQGKTARAMIARAEAAVARTDATARPQSAPTVAEASATGPLVRAEAPVAIPKPAIGSVTVELPPARPASHLEAQAAVPPMPELSAAEQVENSAVAPVEPVELPRPALGSVAVALASAGPAEHLEARDATPPAPELALAVIQPEYRATAPAAAAEQPVAKPRLGSITVELPVAKPAEHLEARVETPPVPQLEDVRPVPASVTVPLPPARPQPAQLPRRADADAVMAEALAPRLERLSRGEVALVTTGKPIWRSSSDVRTASGTTVRWVALASASSRPNVRILNAARSQGLAASARTVLFDRGWRKIAVGDAPAVRRESVVLYPKNREALGRRLARQFGVTAQVAERDDVVLVLGRDAVDRVARQRGS